MRGAWILAAGLATLIAGVRALNSQVIPQPGPPYPIGCAYNTSPPTLTNQQAGWVQCDSTGKIIVSTTGGSVTTTPSAVTTTEVAVAPTATVFSALLVTSTTRKGCLIQNTGTTLGYVYFGATASATTANSFQVAAAQAISCATQTGAVLTDNIAGTCASSTCAFIVGSQ